MVICILPFFKDDLAEPDIYLLFRSLVVLLEIENLSGSAFFYTRILFMKNTYYCRSDITGRTYDLFQCAKILNIQQAIFYLQHGALLMDLKTSSSRKRDKSILVFIFKKEDTCDLRYQWDEYKERLYAGREQYDSLRG